jgi:transcriptional regulator with GAF, ATPase, and Fis domain
MSAPVDPLDPQRFYASVRATIDAVPVDRQPRSVTTTLERICHAATLELELMGSAVNLMSASGADGVVASSGSRARELAEIEFTVGEGPGIEAFMSRRPVLVADLAMSDSRWPGYTSAAQSVDLAAVFAFPLHIGAVGFGVLELYADEPGALDTSQTATASTYARIGTETLLDGESTTADGRLVPSLATALDYRSEIAQAQGMVMVDLRVNLSEALVRLRTHAFTHEEPLISVARKVIDGYVLPGHDDA